MEIIERSESCRLSLAMRLAHLVLAGLQNQAARSLGHGPRLVAHLELSSNHKPQQIVFGSWLSFCWLVCLLNCLCVKRGLNPLVGGLGSRCFLFVKLDSESCFEGGVKSFPAGAVRDSFNSDSGKKSSRGTADKDWICKMHLPFASCGHL